MTEQLDSITLLDTDLLFRLKYYSDTFNIPLRLVVQNLLIKEWARCAAIIEVEGANPSRVLPEFQWDVSEDGSKKLVTGEELFNRLVALYVQELRQPLQADQKLAERMTELNKYKLPGEQAVAREELLRREAKALEEKRKQAKT